MLPYPEFLYPGTMHTRTGRARPGRTAPRGGIPVNPAPAPGGLRAQRLQEPFGGGCAREGEVLESLRHGHNQEGPCYSTQGWSPPAKPWVRRRAPSPPPTPRSPDPSAARAEAAGPSPDASSGHGVVPEAPSASQWQRPRGPQRRAPREREQGSLRASSAIRGGLRVPLGNPAPPPPPRIPAEPPRAPIPSGGPEPRAAPPRSDPAGTGRGWGAPCAPERARAQRRVTALSTRHRPIRLPARSGEPRAAPRSEGTWGTKPPTKIDGQYFVASRKGQLPGMPAGEKFPQGLAVPSSILPRCWSPLECKGFFHLPACRKRSLRRAICGCALGAPTTAGTRAGPTRAQAPHARTLARPGSHPRPLSSAARPAARPAHCARRGACAKPGDREQGGRDP
nr:basic salivary proline-rich protein 2-like [Cavia porcellus]